MGARLFRCFMHLQWVSLLFAISPLQFLFFLQRQTKKKQKTRKKNNKLHLTPSPWGVWEYLGKGVCEAAFLFAKPFHWEVPFLPEQIQIVRSCFQLRALTDKQKDNIYQHANQVYMD